MTAMPGWKEFRTGMLVMAGWLSCATAPAAVIAPELAAELATLAPQDELPVIVTLSDRVDHRQFRRGDRRWRDGELIRALRAKAATTQGSHRTFLQNNGARRLRELWTINGMAVTAPVAAIRRMAARPGIKRISLDSNLQAPATTYGEAAPPEWNLDAVNAPGLWALGHAGAGVVVANMDTGVDAAHPDLATRWRGGDNSWYDPHGQHASPHDSDGHGTQTMAIMVGGAAGGTAIGMAPDARWIAVKLYDDAGQASYSDIHLAFQWLLDPDGDPDTADAPDVVNASWGLAGSAGICDTEFSQDIEALRTAGIAVVFAAGNDGPSPQTSLSPANNPQAFSAGAVDASLTVAGFSSRGASACDGGIYPKLVAPGVNVNTADLSFGGLPFYAVVTGTSFAAPHAAGAMALLAGAFPEAPFSRIEAALTGSARDLGLAGEDNSYGHGLADVLAAYQLMLAGSGSPPTITSTPPTAANEGSQYNYAVVASDDDGDPLTYSLDTAPAGMAIDPVSGLIAWTPGGSQTGTNAVTVRVADPGGLFATQSYAIQVASLNEAPVAAADAYAMVARTTLNVSAGGVLANDADPDGDAMTAILVRDAAKGRLTLNGDGSFFYVPRPGFVGADSFTYRAHDGVLSSAEVTVTLAVNANQAPVANDDSASVAMRMPRDHAENVIDVLANDVDFDGQIDRSSIRIMMPPNRGGTAVANPDGTIAYMPRPGFVGIERLRYRVRDQAGKLSNPATVTLVVQLFGATRLWRQP